MLSSGDLINTRICIAVMRQYRCNFLTSSPVIFTATFPKYHITHQSPTQSPLSFDGSLTTKSRDARGGVKKLTKKEGFYTVKL